MTPLSKKPSRRACYLLLLTLGAALLTPVWLVRYPPLVDYPNHLAGAFILAHLHDARFEFHRFYTSNWGLSPYLVMDATLAGLAHAMDVELAGKLFLSLCLIAVPLGAWIFLRHANPGNDWLAVWPLLIAYNFFLFYGFLNLQLSVALSFLAVGLWLGYLGRPRARQWWLLLLLFTLLYFTHLFGFVMAGLLVGVYGLLKRQRVAELLRSWLLFVPGCCFYLAWRFAAQPNWPVERRPWHEKFAALAPFMQGYSSRLDYFTLAVMAVCAFAAWWRNPEWRWNRWWFCAACVVFGLYWLLPETYGTGWPVDQRVLPFLFVVLLAAAQVGRRARVLAMAAVIVFVARIGNTAYHFVAEQAELSALARCFDATPANATVLPVVEAKDDAPFLRSYPHFWAYGAIRRGWLSPYVFAQGNVTPLHLRPGIYLEEGFWDLEYDESPDWDAVREQYDYVWAYNVAGFAADLEEIGHVVCTNKDLRVYRLEKPSAALWPSDF